MNLNKFLLVFLCRKYIICDHFPIVCTIKIIHKFFSVYSIGVFPDYFKFGSASSAYQVEGAWNVDGRSPSIWDTYTHENPHLIENASTGDIASNSYNFYKKDVAALKSVGVSLT